MDLKSWFIGKNDPFWQPLFKITSEKDFLNRRAFLKKLGLSSTAMVVGTAFGSAAWWNKKETKTGFDLPQRASDSFYPAKQNEKFLQVEDREITPGEITGRYNNFYEFTTDKEDVAILSSSLTIDPWMIEIGGLVEKPFSLNFEDLISKFSLEERIYRMRCVEAWSMVVPWTGFPLAELVKFCKPLSSATHIRFLSFLRPEEAPGQKRQMYSWPYYEGLRMDEAMNELAMVVTGIYGKPLSKQHGAPLRIIIPWKYGYKSPKSIVKISFIDKEPSTFWNDLAPDEYSFLSNVDPEIPHPRWSQMTERDIGTEERIPTLKYNGYEKWVAGLYPDL